MDRVGSTVITAVLTTPRKKPLTRPRAQLTHSSTPVPELRTYKLWNGPIGPHPVAMFEVNIFTPAQFGAFVAWLAVWRGPLSVLVHPNTVTTGDPAAASEGARRDHGERAIWMGERIPLDMTVL